MSDTSNEEIERRLRELEGSGGNTRSGGPNRPNPVVAILGVIVLCGLGAAAYLALQDDPEVPMPTATPDEFQTDGGDFGAIEPFVPAPAPEPEVVVVEAPPAEPNAELLAQLAALQAEIEAIRNAPEPVVEEDTAAADAIEALTAQISALQASSENAQSAFQEELSARDRQLRQLRLDLDAARLEAQNRPPAPIPSGPTEEELAERERQRLLAAEEAERQRRLRENEAARIAELERRRAEEAAFQQARIDSPTIAFGGGDGGGEGGLEDRIFSEGADFVFNGARPAQVSQAEVIANPSNTVPQGTMIQAVLETAIDSSSPGQVRATISEDVHSFDGARTLIPRGARLIGRYRSGASVGEQRVTVGWDRIILPSNQSVTISSFGGDELGRSGVTGFVDNRARQRFGGSALISLISGGTDAAAGSINSRAGSDVASDVGDDFRNASRGALSDQLSLGPVIYVDQGATISVMVDRDLEIF
ncbi:TrbI/VirB10 family protein [Jannaschia rubra]|uniref:Pertussis toxin liberation protein G n=1 Tax=Jannaschia rubra TaxID=282197 RepID=A0A0M6XVZ5_9RHOB|nr:TrbI/VirB10 family protein [Jannaschia rubra]CTQ34463.1 Pertussis toxin liberation protein G [Jannaschia rubra]